MANRTDRCKCGEMLKWSTDDAGVECPHCGTKYRVDCDSVLVYWLEEIVEQRRPYRTDAR